MRMIIEWATAAGMVVYGFQPMMRAELEDHPFRSALAVIALLWMVDAGNLL